MLRQWFVAALLGSLGGGAVASSQNADPGIDEAMRQARQQQVPVIVDFYAPWCYSCYYMAQHVLVGADWDTARGDAIVVGVDVDSAEGAALKQRWGIKPLPSYLVLNPDAEELGRIGGERTPEQFYAEIAAIRSRGAPLEKLQARAAQGEAAAAVEALALYHARYEAEAGLEWFDSLDKSKRDRLEADSQVQARLDRLRLMQAAADEDIAACLATGEKVLAADPGCERPYEVSRYVACTTQLEPAERKSRLLAQIPAMQSLVDDKALVRPPLCADQRSAVTVTAELYEATGQADKAQALLERAATDARERLAGDLKSDRNLADNLRVFLAAANDTSALDVLYPQLIAAYPQDYVYANRFARSLAARGLDEQALPYFRAAADRAYGVNRLRNASSHADSLHALGRDKDAIKVLASAIKANGPFFPDELAELKRQMRELRGR